MTNTIELGRLASMTEEERAEMKEKSLQTRLAKQAYAEEHLKTEYADMDAWEDMAKEAGVRLPYHYIPNTEIKYARRIAKKIGVDLKEYFQDCGVKNISELNNLNPTFTARAMCGLILEYKVNR